MRDNLYVKIVLDNVLRRAMLDPLSCRSDRVANVGGSELAVPIV